MQSTACVSYYSPSSIYGVTDFNLMTDEMMNFTLKCRHTLNFLEALFKIFEREMLIGNNQYLSFIHFVNACFITNAMSKVPYSTDIYFLH